jgi:predicted phage terminase large subunit-like protein
VPGAAFTSGVIDANRRSVAPDMTRVVVAVDPAGTSHEEADETGIVVVGKGVDGHAYVLADRSCRASPDAWARRAVAAYTEFRADRIVAEVNFGGDMVRSTIATVDRRVPFTAVHASRGKRQRIEPVAALAEQGKVHHIGVLAELEDQLLTWTPEDGTSPDRLDAFCWGVTDLMLGGPRGAAAF